MDNNNVSSSHFNTNHQDKLILTDDKVNLQDFCINSPELAAYLLSYNAIDRPQRFIELVEVGIFCVQRAGSTIDTEFIRRRTDELVTMISGKVEQIPESLKIEIAKIIGTDDGQVLQPIVELIEQSNKASKDRITEVKDLLREEIDPSKETSSLAKAISGIKNLLDPNRTDSVQGKIDQTLSKIASKDGEISKTVQLVVTEALKPLKDEVDELGKEIRGKQAAEEAVNQTTKKGATFEDELLEKLRPWANSNGAQLEHIGPKNGAGDILIEFGSTSAIGCDLRIVIEARDRNDKAGRKRISEDISTKMTAQEANVGLYISRTQSGLANEIGEWADGEVESGIWVASTIDHLFTSLRFLIVMHKVRFSQEQNAQIDVTTIGNQVTRIRTVLAKITTIKTKAKAIRDNADVVNTLGDDLKAEIQSALAAVEESILRMPTLA